MYITALKPITKMTIVIHTASNRGAWKTVTADVLDGYGT